VLSSVANYCTQPPILAACPGRVGDLEGAREVWRHAPEPLEGRPHHTGLARAARSHRRHQGKGRRAARKRVVSAAGSAKSTDGVPGAGGRDRGGEPVPLE